MRRGRGGCGRDLATQNRCGRSPRRLRQAANLDETVDEPPVPSVWAELQIAKATQSFRTRYVFDDRRTRFLTGTAGASSFQFSISSTKVARLVDDILNWKEEAPAVPVRKRI